MLRKAEAVLYCKSSVPHTLMCGETVNNIIGYTLNPKNRAVGVPEVKARSLVPEDVSYQFFLFQRHPSKGETIVSVSSNLGIAPMGLGTDIGGSIRIPAAFKGLYGLRPSANRLPYQGMANSMDGQNTILSVVGPIATNTASIKLITQTLLAEKPWLFDPLVHEIPWRTSKEEEGRVDKLCLGVIRSDGIDAGHEVIEWAGPSHKPINDACFDSWLYDGGADVKGAFALSGEPTSSQINFFMSLDKQFTGSEIAATNVKLRNLKKEYLEYWNDTVKLTSTGRPVDAIISPLAPFAAARPGKYTYYGYSTWVNALDYTSIVIPVTNVDWKLDRKSEGYTALSDLDKQIQNDYDPEIYAGAHISLQVVGRRLEEEKMLAIAQRIEALG